MFAREWVAESLVRKAREHGWPVTIYRPGLLTGTATDGVSDNENFIWHLIRVSVALGIFPDCDRQLDMTPVDWLSQGVERVKTFRHDAPEATFVDLPCQALISNPAGAVERLRDRLGCAISDGHHQRIREFMANQRQHKQSPH